MNELLKLMQPSQNNGHCIRNDGITKDISSHCQFLPYFYPLKIIVVKPVHLNLNSFKSYYTEVDQLPVPIPAQFLPMHTCRTQAKERDFVLQI